MRFAASASKRSISRICSSAAIVSQNGEVVATGRNEVPAPGGGQYSAPTDTRPTARDCDVGEDSNAKERIRIELEIADVIETRLRAEFEEVTAKLSAAESDLLVQKVDQVRAIVEAALPRTALRDITEYGRAVHAEMSALMSVARTGASTRGATLFCTTFPCHTCAKHIAAAGIARVVFVEPYPKSKARDLHADSIDLVGEALEGNRKAELTASLAAERTRFEPFLGVGPRRYFDLFSMRLGTGRRMMRKAENGDALKFEPTQRHLEFPLQPRHTWKKKSRLQVPSRMQDSSSESNAQPNPVNANEGKEATMSKSSFWQSVEELAAMREYIPEERRALSGVRRALGLDVRSNAPTQTELELRQRER